MKIRIDEDPAPLRRADYPAIGDQLDAIMKGFKAMQAQGVELPPETQAWLDDCQAVKDRYKTTPKSTHA